jgi:hypothetical protein
MNRTFSAYDTIFCRRSRKSIGKFKILLREGRSSGSSHQRIEARTAGSHQEMGAGLRAQRAV